MIFKAAKLKSQILSKKSECWKPNARDHKECNSQGLLVLTKDQVPTEFGTGYNKIWDITKHFLTKNFKTL